MMKLRYVWLPLLVLVSFCQAQLRVATYNIKDGVIRDGLETVLEAICLEEVNGIVKPLDVLILQEMTPGHSSDDAIVTILNGLYGPGVYVRANQCTSCSHMCVNIIYNSQTVSLVDTDYFKYAGSPRHTGRYQIRPMGYGSAADIYIYNTHYKAGDTSGDQVTRAWEAREVRWGTYGSDQLPAGANCIFAGDYNMKKSTEDVTMPTGYDHNRTTGGYDNPYAYLIEQYDIHGGSTGNGVAVDPINRPGYWNGSASFIDVHTQSPGLLTAGGMDDRFDIQMITTDMYDGEGISYIGPGVGDITVAAHSYRAFGNNGTHDPDGLLSSGTGAAPEVLLALEAVSDHLPVVADYQLPARMSVSVGEIPFPKVLAQGSTYQLALNISNTAPVAVSVGADELDWQVYCDGAVSGNGGGTTAALGTSTHYVTLATNATGSQNGLVYVYSHSQAVANSTSLTTIEYRVVAYQDFDGDGDFDIADLNLMTAHLGGSDPLYDLHPDGVVNEQDLDILVHDILGTEYGDANLDGMVNEADLTRLAAGWLNGGVWENGNFNGDARVDLGDVGLLMQNWQFGQ